MILKFFRPHLCLCLLTLIAASALAAEPAVEKSEKKEEAKAPAEQAAESGAAKEQAKEQAKEEAKEEAKPDKPEIKTVAVKKGPMRIVVELEGVFEGDDAKEIILAPEEWSKLTVVSAAKHGARVRKGDVILELETEKLDRAIADLQG